MSNGHKLNSIDQIIMLDRQAQRLKSRNIWISPNEIKNKHWEYQFLVIQCKLWFRESGCCIHFKTTGNSTILWPHWTNISNRFKVNNPCDAWNFKQCFLWLFLWMVVYILLFSLVSSSGIHWYENNHNVFFSSFCFKPRYWKVVAWGLRRKKVSCCYPVSRYWSRG